jgi:beta-glucosidase
MTSEEKYSLMHGLANKEYTGSTAAIERLGIPRINSNDGPQGYRDESNKGSSTQFPSSLALASSWDENAVY